MSNKLRKWFGDGRGGLVLPCRCLGIFTDGHGVKHRAYMPTGLRMSVWVRLEPCKGGRARMCYDPQFSIASRLRKK